MKRLGERSEAKMGAAVSPARSALASMRACSSSEARKPIFAWRFRFSLPLSCVLPHGGASPLRSAAALCFTLSQRFLLNAICYCIGWQPA
jgi:hypothetical protein